MFQLKEFVRILRDNWWIILLTGLAAVTASLFLSYQETPVYRARATLLTSPNTALEDSGDLIDTIESQSKVMSTYAEILNSPTVRKQALTELGIDASQHDSYSAETVVLPDADVIELTVLGADPRVAANLANRIGQYGIDLIQNRYPVYYISFLDMATTPSQPYSPQPLRDAGVAAALGLLAGVVFALIRHSTLANGSSKAVATGNA